MSRITFLIFLVTISSSCKPALLKMYKFNRPFDFVNRGQYFDYLKNKLEIESSTVIYPDSSTAQQLLRELSAEPPMILYGCFVDDSTSLGKSPLLMENVGCLGRLIAEVKSNSSKNKSESTPLVKRNSLRRMGFKYMLNDSTVHFTSGNKMKLLLFYNYSIGNYYNAFFTEIARMLKENPDLLELFVITLDAYNFKN